MKQTPITIVTGFLGSGKTTVILNLIKQLPKGYKAVWLKNEYGDLNIDSILAKENNIQTVEILNGCLCCVLVGKLKDAILEIEDKYSPDRIIIETAGTAYPYSILMEIDKINNEKKDSNLKVDGVIQIIDAINFRGLKDKSIVAKMQAPLVDLIVINKTKGIDESELDQRLDDVYEVYPDTPKIKTEDGFVNSNLLIGLDHKLVDLPFPRQSEGEGGENSDFGGVEPGEGEHQHNHEGEEEIDIFTFSDSEKIFDLSKIEKILDSIKNDDFYRIKGVVKTSEGFFLLNWVFGKTSWSKLEKYNDSTRITFMGHGINLLKEKVLSMLNS